MIILLVGSVLMGTLLLVNKKFKNSLKISVKTYCKCQKTVL